MDYAEKFLGTFKADAIITVNKKTFKECKAICMCGFVYITECTGKPCNNLLPITSIEVIENFEAEKEN